MSKEEKVTISLGQLRQLREMEYLSERGLKYLKEFEDWLEKEEKK